MNQLKILLSTFLICLALYSQGQVSEVKAVKYHPGYFVVNANDKERVYFHTTSDSSTKRKAFLNSKQYVFVQKTQNDFGYVLFINTNNQKSTGWLPMKYLSRDTARITQKVGAVIKGNFVSNEHSLNAYMVQTKLGKGNPVEDGTANEYAIFFSDELILPINIECCQATIINEGDLNNDGNDELSVFQAPMNGCVYYMYTYSFQNGSWKKIIPSFVIPAACDGLSEVDLQKRIFKEKGIIYFYDVDVNNENFSLLKKKALIK